MYGENSVTMITKIVAVMEAEYALPYFGDPASVRIVGQSVGRSPPYICKILDVGLLVHLQ